jgi:hypothetical protein
LALVEHLVQLSSEGLVSTEFEKERFVEKVLNVLGVVEGDWCS